MPPNNHCKLLHTLLEIPNGAYKNLKSYNEEEPALWTVSENR